MGNTNTKSDLPQRQRLERRISKNWAPFAHNLSQVLARLEEDQFLILSSKHGNRFLQFSCQGAWGMRAEVASNHFLKGNDRLSRREMAWLRTHGWNSPTGTGGQATPEYDPDGSPNYYIDFPVTVPASDIAKLVIDTLAQGLAVPHPGTLTYESFDSERGQLAFEDLGLKPSACRDIPLMDRVLSVFREVTGIEDLAFDKDGDLAVRYGAISICITQLNNRIRLFSGLVIGVEETPALLRKLNQVNHGAHSIRFIWHEDVVYAMLDVPGDPFVPAHLVTAMNQFSEVAEGLAIVLRAELSGHAVIEASGAGTCLQ